MPIMRRFGGLAHREGAVPMLGMPAPDLCDGRHDLRGHSETAAHMVQSDVVRHESEAGRECLGAPTRPRVAELSNCLDMVSQAAASLVWPGREHLSGRVEVDETYVGGVERGVRGRETFAKSIVVMAAQADGDGIGRIRMCRVPNVSADSLLPFLHEAVERGSVVHADGWRGYARLSEQGYIHEVTTLTRSGDPAHLV